MRKLMITLTLTLSLLAVSASLNATIPTPECAPNCPVLAR